MVRIVASRTMWVKRTTLFFAVGLAAMLGVLLMAAGDAHAATFTINSTGDSGDNRLGDGLCFTGVFIQVGPRFVRECTLRAAIEETNANNNDATIVDAIHFNIPSSAPTCNANTNVCTISPASNLPPITEAVTIDGYSQPGASENTRAVGDNAVLLIQLNGANVAPHSWGLRINASNSLVKGLVINRFGRGLQIGTGFEDSPDATDNQIEGNFIGTNAKGTADLGNIGSGVTVFDSNNTVGDASRAARNLISGNGGPGFEANGLNHQVLGNYIGTDRTGTKDLGNDSAGVRFFSGNHTVGGDTAAGANVIAFNGSDGVQIIGNSSTGLGILGNSIFSNGEQGIDLDGDGRTTNDVGDADTGPNNLQNFPVLTSAETVGATTTIKGRLNSTPDTQFVVRFFSNPSNDNEGKRYIGQIYVTTNASGNTGTFTFAPTQKVSVGQRITATATDPGSNTSEFSAAREVTGGVIGGTAS